MIYSTLSQSGILLEGELPCAPMQGNEILENVLDLHKCAFCTPKVIKKQLVCKWGATYILMSHKPTSPYGNFLILPQRHQCAWNLTPDEALQSLQAVIALKRTLLETTGSNDWICYIQDGSTVGQTVPHTHIHFYILPDPLKSALSNLQHIHNQRLILSYEQMRAGYEQIEPLLLAKLSEIPSLEPLDVESFGRSQRSLLDSQVEHAGL